MCQYMQGFTVRCAIRSVHVLYNLQMCIQICKCAQLTYQKYKYVCKSVLSFDNKPVNVTSSNLHKNVVYIFCRCVASTLTQVL